MTDLSVVVPVYGCEPCLRALHERVRKATAELAPDTEIIFVDDRSTDRAWETIRALARKDPRVRALRLSRNFGQHPAITAGLSAARGRWTVVMDCDLQDPPEAIPRLLAKAQEGYDVVLARRSQRRQHWLRRGTGNAYYRVHNALLKSDMYVNYSQFSILSRTVVDAFLRLRDKDRQYLMIVQWLGFERAEIEVDPGDRYAGRSSYSFASLLNVAVDGMFFQTTVLLRWIVYAGFLMAALGIALAAYATFVFAFGRPHPDWLAVSMAALLLTGFIVISTGVTGLYVGKIFDQVKGRPLYVVDSEIVEGVERPSTDAAPTVVEATGVEPTAPVESPRESLRS
jgi:glycosyltransferase involved in cell wall biosynthesis